MRQAAQQSSEPSAWPQLGLVPGQVLRAFGMRRSGNHAIADWLQRNAPSGTSVFLNNCKPATDPLRNFRSIEVNGTPEPGKAALTDLAAHTTPAGDGALLLITYEDTAPSEFQSPRNVSGTLDETLIDHDLIIYRSFLNWAASLLRKLQANTGFTVSRRAAIVLRATDTYTRLLELVEARDELCLTCICYDDWAASATYRQNILVALGLAQNDNSLGRVQRYGGGSSFQKDVDDPSKLQTNQRWAEMGTDPEFQSILHLAARDTVLTDRLSRLFPRDATRLARIATVPPLSHGALA